MSWRRAVMESPGPKTPGAAVLLFLKGLCMGSADIIPGVSGGTIALITGIYSDLLRAIGSFNMLMVQRLLRMDVRGALAGVHLRFILPLLAGIGVAILSLARLMNHLLHTMPVYTWSLFFGLIAASILVVAGRIDSWRLSTWGMLATGAAAAHLIVNLIPVATPETLPFVFFSGLVAICAMILPGLSGAFILLILGKYAYITGCLKNPFLPDNLVTILVFCLGCGCGLMGFSRLLNYLMDRHRQLLLAFLVGLMAGSMQRIWPWKVVAAVRTIRDKEHILWGGPTWPQAFNGEVVAAIGIMAVGCVLVLLLERLTAGKKPSTGC